MSFHEVQFSVEISYGSAGGPGFFTEVITSDSGQENRVSRRSQTKHRYDVAFGIRNNEDLAEIKKFYLARKGSAFGFRYKDWADFHSAVDNPGYETSPGVADQICLVVAGSSTQFQLAKTYTSGPSSYVRKIVKPIGSTVRMWVGGVEQIGNWTINETTGVVTFTATPSQTPRASFQFDVPVRFSKSADDLLSSSIDDFGGGSMQSIELEEILEISAGPTGEYLYGGSSEIVIAASTQISSSYARVWRISASTTGLSVLLEDLTPLPGGDGYFTIFNDGANTFAVRDHLSNLLVNLAAGQGVEAFISENNSGGKAWYAF
jgi:uncharacterized protein (TIGR02217 family)